MPLRQSLTRNTVSTAYEMGWSQLSNGELLDAAEQGDFDLLITSDKNIRYQQNLAIRTIAIRVLTTTSWPQLREHTSEIIKAVGTIEPGEYRELEWAPE